MAPLDTRLHKRFEMHIPVLFEFKDEAMRNRFQQGNAKLEGEMLDISVGGMCIITKYFAPKGVLLKIYAKLPLEEDKGPKELSAEGEIRSVVPWKGANNRLGIQFVNLSDSTRGLIGEFIKKHERRSEPRLNVKDIGSE